MIVSRIFTLVSVLWALEYTSSYVVTPVLLFGSRRSKSSPAAAQHSRWPLHAVVYDPSDEGGASSYWDDDETTVSSLKEENERSTSSLKDTLLRDGAGSLAKLAAAFSPPGQSINLKDIEDLQVLDIDDHHIDIVAVVCEKESCATHMVPVSFVTECEGEGSNMEGCVLDNVEQLSAQADTRLKELEWTQAHEQDTLRSFQELASLNQGLELPTWWVPPASLAQDCDDIQRILNGHDFQTQVRALAIRALRFMDNGRQELEVESATVVALCPAGIFLRVTAKETGMFEAGNIKVVDVPFAFGGEQAKDGSSLRDAVQDSITSAIRYVEKFS